MEEQPKKPANSESLRENKFSGRGTGVVRPQKTSGLGAVIFFLIASPLLALALTLGTWENVHRSLEKTGNRIVFRVLLRQGVPVEGAEALARELSASKATWRSAQVVSPSENFAIAPSLAKWAASHEAIVQRLSFSVVLIPARPLQYPLQEVDAAESLRKRAEVAEVFCDREGVLALAAEHAAWKTVFAALAAALAALTLVGAGAARLAVTRALRPDQTHPEEPRATPQLGRLSPAARLAASGSGLAVLLVLAATCVLLRTATQLRICFLSPPQDLFVVIAGAACGVWATRAPRSRNRSSRIPLALILACLLSPGAQSAPDTRPPNAEIQPADAPPPVQVPETPSPAPPARIRQDQDAAGGLESLNSRIAERERRLRRLADWLELPQAERESVLKGRTLNRARVDLARRKLEQLASILAREEQTLLDLVQSANDVPFSSLSRSSPDISAHTRDALTQQMVFQAARESLRLREGTLEETHRAEAVCAQLEEAENRLETWERFAELSQKDLLEEKSRLEEEWAELKRQRAELLGETETAGGAGTDGPPDALSGERKPSSGLSTQRSALSAQHSALSAQRSARVHYVFLPQGTEVHAVEGGKVLFAAEFMGLGKTVVLAHGKELSTVYGFMDRLFVEAGQNVRTGQRLGTAGYLKGNEQSGIRFEVRRNGALARLEDLRGITAANLESRLKGK
jgi:murein DD-endopeptidase MepM/ murein hydrolase activator NlpD